MLKIFRVAVPLVVMLAGAHDYALAQSVADGGNATSAVTTQAQTDAPRLVNPSLGSTFTAVGGDLRRMFSTGSVPLAVAFAGSALVATRWDGAAVGEARELPLRDLTAGNTAGALVTQMGAAFGTYAVGKMTGNSRLALTGSELIRAQVASQLVVQSLKLAAGRSRPDDSNHFSFPSGHAASAFATATVLQREFGWKAGIPAYAVGAYVATARMGSNKHYLSDVIIGAAIGVTAGRAVTVGSGRGKFDVGLAATDGGAAVSFTKKN